MYHSRHGGGNTPPSQLQFGVSAHRHGRVSSPLFHLSQDETVQDGQLLNVYSSFLADALAWDIMLETGVSGPSLVLANHPFAKQGHKWHCIPA